MSTSIILILFAIALFVAYNAVSIAKFGIPHSLSETYYLYESLRKHLGYVFTAFMFVLGFSILPAWLTLSDASQGWHGNFTFLAFLAGAAICFVGAAPAFRSCQLESRVHTISATLSAVFALSWCFLVETKLWYVPLVAIAIVLAVALWTKTFKQNKTYWLEMAAFVSTFATILIASLL